jgi:hypothetical protein
MNRDWGRGEVGIADGGLKNIYQRVFMNGVYPEG